MPKISVIIPVYNTEKYLRKCLDSVCNQTLSDIEIICINDCSTDNSLAILKEYPVKIIDLPENKGAAYARNRGIEAATGDYIGFVDSDDFVDLDFYEKLYNKAVETGADITKGNYKNATDNIVDYSLNNKIKEDKNCCAFAYCSAIFKRILITENNIKFPNLIDMEDPVFTFKAALEANTVEIIDSACVNIVKREGSLTSRIPNLKQIQDKFQGLQIILDIANTSATLKKETYLFIISFWVLQTFQNSILNTEYNVRKFVAENLLSLYKKINYKKEFINILKEKNIILAKNLEDGNPNDLISYKEISAQKILLAKLRNRIKETMVNA